MKQMRDWFVANGIVMNQDKTQNRLCGLVNDNYNDIVDTEIKTLGLTI